MLYPFTLTNILYNHQVLEFGSGMGEPAPGPWYEACPPPPRPSQVPHIHMCKHSSLQVEAQSADP